MTDSNESSDMSTAAPEAEPQIDRDTTVDTDEEEAEDTASGGPA